MPSGLGPVHTARHARREISHLHSTLSQTPAGHLHGCTPCCEHWRVHPLQVPCPSIFSEPSKELTVVIPAYNEEQRLPATLQEMLR